MLMEAETSDQVSNAILISAGLWKRHRTNGSGDSYILIKSMVDEYLQATVAMIKRGFDKDGAMVPADRVQWLPILEDELMVRELDDGWDK